MIGYIGNVNIKKHFRIFVHWALGVYYYLKANVMSNLNYTNPVPFLSYIVSIFLTRWKCWGWTPDLSSFAQSNV